MAAAKMIRDRRLELGLSDVDVAGKLGLTVSELGDIELHDDVLETVVPLGTVRELCSLLNLPLQQVLKMSVDKASRFCVGRRPGEVVMRRREQSGYSRLDLAEKVGFDEATIKSLETVPSFGNTLPIFLLKDIEAELELPEGSIVLADWDQ